MHLRKRAAQLHLQDRVSLVGAAESERVAQWLAAANVLVLPSYAEGCPNVVIEALSSGRPVIGSDVGGIAELMNDTCGILIPPRDVAALTRAIQSAMERDWNDRLISDHFQRGWDHAAAEILSMLEHVIENRRRQWQPLAETNLAIGR
jgi:glycosyltransferase involved in cell wall biosynthesis